MTFGSLSRYRYRYQHSQSPRDGVEPDKEHGEEGSETDNEAGPTNLLCFNCRTARHYGRLVDSRATVIVCPEAILPQWEREVAANVRPGTVRVRVYRGLRHSYDVLRRRGGADKKDVASTLDPKQLADSDVVRILLVTSWPRA